MVGVSLPVLLQLVESLLESGSSSTPQAPSSSPLSSSLIEITFSRIDVSDSSELALSGPESSLSLSEPELQMPYSERQLLRVLPCGTEDLVVSFLLCSRLVFLCLQAYMGCVDL